MSKLVIVRGRRACRTMRALWLLGLVLVVVGGGCGDDDGTPRRDAETSGVDASAGPVEALRSCFVEERLFPMQLEGRSGIARAAQVRVIGVISASLATNDRKTDPLALFEVTSSRGEAKRAQAQAKRRGLNNARVVGPVWYRHNEDWTPRAVAAVERCLRSLP